MSNGGARVPQLIHISGKLNWQALIDKHKWLWPRWGSQEQITTPLELTTEVWLRTCRAEFPAWCRSSHRAPRGQINNYALPANTESPFRNGFTPVTTFMCPLKSGGWSRDCVTAPFSHETETCEDERVLESPRQLNGRVRTGDLISSCSVPLLTWDSSTSYSKRPQGKRASLAACEADSLLGASVGTGAGESPFCPPRSCLCSTSPSALAVCIHCYAFFFLVWHA